MNYQARLNDILTMLDQGEYLGDGGVESAQEDVTALFLESVGENETPPTRFRLGALEVTNRNGMRENIRSKWQTNQEGE